MTITITDYQIQENTHDIYDVHFNSYPIRAIVTHDRSVVVYWINQIEDDYRANQNNHPLIVGLDVKHRPTLFHGDTRTQLRPPIANLQLCVGQSCLIFQIFTYFSNFNHTDEIPNNIPVELIQFLANEKYIFVGHMIRMHLAELRSDWQVEVRGKIVDRRQLIPQANKIPITFLTYTHLIELSKVVLGIKSDSDWDNPCLNLDQVIRACLVAYLCFDMGWNLNASDYQN